MIESSPSVVPAASASLVDGPVERTPLVDGSGFGGVCVFMGTTRPESHPALGELRQLTYRVAEPLTSARMEILASSILDRHDLLQLHLRHAVGDVPIGADSVRIEAAAEHRVDAFAACREAIDRLKSEIPIWKLECWTRGERWSSASMPLEQPR